MGEIDRLYREARDQSIRLQRVNEQLRQQAEVDTAALARWRALADALAGSLVIYDPDSPVLARYRKASQRPRSDDEIRDAIGMEGDIG